MLQGHVRHHIASSVGVVYDMNQPPVTLGLRITVYRPFVLRYRCLQLRMYCMLQLKRCV